MLHWVAWRPAGLSHCWEHNLSDWFLYTIFLAQDVQAAFKWRSCFKLMCIQWYTEKTNVFTLKATNWLHIYVYWIMKSNWVCANKFKRKMLHNCHMHLFKNNILKEVQKSLYHFYLYVSGLLFKTCLLHLDIIWYIS